MDAVVNGAPMDASIAMCGCGNPRSHRGMCSARWALRKLRYGDSGNASREFDFSTELVRQRGKLLRIALGWSRGNADEADEWVSQAVLKAMENQHQFEVGTNFAGWLTTILKNIRNDGDRRAKKHVGLTIETDGEEVERVDPALIVPPMQESGIVVREMADELRGLTPTQREALLRSEMDGQQYEEIAEQTGVSVGTVKSRISRARARLNGEARVIPAVSRQNADALDFVLSKLREERDRISAAIVSLEQCRGVFKGVL